MHSERIQAAFAYLLERLSRSQVTEGASRKKSAFLCPYEVECHRLSGFCCCYGDGRS